MFRSCQIIIRELCCSLLKLYYPDDDLTRSKHVGVILSIFKVFYVKVM